MGACYGGVKPVLGGKARLGRCNQNTFAAPVGISTPPTVVEQCSQCYLVKIVLVVYTKDTARLHLAVYDKTQSVHQKAG
jgi:hypothetical protein